MTKSSSPAQQLQTMLDSSLNLRALVEESISIAKNINPDKTTNPAQSLEELYEYIRWSEIALPNALLKDAEYSSLYDHIDQGIDYLFWILDQPLEALRNSGFYYSSTQYIPQIARWIKEYCKDWGRFLSSPQSWNDTCIETIKNDKHFSSRLHEYEDSENWHSFNQFFSRKLASLDARPIFQSNDNHSIISPVDGICQGQWHIDRDGQIERLCVKSRRFGNVNDLLGNDLDFKNVFNNGTLTHIFLDIDDYHRYHFPVNGQVIKQWIIPGGTFSGGTYKWDSDNKRYWLDCWEPGWESIETRGCVVVKTEEIGYVACLPVGMSQIASVNFSFEDEYVCKGDEMGYFLFGGSDFILIFQEQAKFKLDKKIQGRHVLMGEKIGEA